jgi:hypothetical protein
MKRILPTCLLMLSTVLILFFNGCNKSEVKSTPNVVTDSVNRITNNSAYVYGDVTNDQTEVVVARGICWSTSANPTIHSNKTVVSGGMWNFSSKITGLSSNTKYYVRAYATLQELGSDATTGYGQNLSFTTLP